MAADESAIGDAEVFSTWTTYTTRDGLPDDRVRAVRVDGDRVWIGTDGGLALVEGTLRRHWTAKDGLPHPVVNAIDVDASTGDVWLGTMGGGMARFTGGRFDAFHQLNSGLAGNLVFDVRVADGNVWCATNGGVSVYDVRNKSWSLYAERRADAPERAFTRLDVDPITASLVGSAWCDGLWRFDPGHGEPERIDVLDRRAGAVSHADSTIGVVAAADGLWSATQDGIARRDRAGAWRWWPIPMAATGGAFVQAIAARDGAQAWLATESGVTTFVATDPPTWITYQGGSGDAVKVTRITGDDAPTTTVLSSNSPGGPVHCAAFDRGGVWIGTEGGLAHGAEPVPWSRLATADGTQRAEHAAIAEDHNRVDHADSPAPRAGAGDRPVPVAAVQPLNRTVALPGAVRPGFTARSNLDLLAFQLAVENANRTRGPASAIAFEPVQGAHGYLRYAWGTPEDDWPVFVFERNVAGLVGAFDSTSRIATAVALRMGVPTVNASTLDVPIDEAIHPWMFRCPRHDPRRVARVLEHLHRVERVERMAIVRTPEASAAALRALRKAADALCVSIEADVVVDLLAAADSARIAELAGSNTQAIVAVCDAPTAAAALRTLRRNGATQWFVGSDRIVCDAFVASAGRDAGAVLAPLPCAHLVADDASDWFAKRYRLQRVVSRPASGTTQHARATFDATEHLLEAIRRIGNDRQAVRRQLQIMSETGVVVLENGVWRAAEMEGD